MSEAAFDLFIIGAGSGGVRAARMAGQRGLRVAVAEDAALGGTCVNLGCIPKKLYSFAAHYAEGFEESHGFGWTGAAPTFDWSTLKANRAAEIGRLNVIYAQLLVGAGVSVLKGRARVVAPGDVEVAGQRHRARHIVVATGGWPVPPDVPGGELAISSNEIFDLAEFPRRLVIVGGGYIACEFASIFNGLGAKVTQLYRGDRLLRGFDDDVRGFVGAEMAKKGVDIRVPTNVASLCRDSGGTIRVALDGGGELDADAVLYATGRAPNTAGLGLEGIGVALAPNGAVIVDERYRSNVPGVHAIGDVIDRVQLTPVALAEAMALVDGLFGDGDRRVDYRHIPTAVFTHPNIGTIGLSEAEARSRFARVRIYRSDFKALRHTLSGSAERTLLKLVVDDESGPRRRPAHGGRRSRRDDPGFRRGHEGRRDQGSLRRHAGHSPDRGRGVRDDARARGGMMRTTSIATRFAMPIDAFPIACRAGISLLLASLVAASRSRPTRALPPARRPIACSRRRKRATASPRATSSRRRKADALKMKSEADVMRSQLEQSGVDLKSEVTTLDRTSASAVAAYNARIDARDKSIDALDAKAAAYNQQVADLQAAQDAKDKNCADRRYDENQLKPKKK